MLPCLFNLACFFLLSHLSLKHVDVRVYCAVLLCLVCLFDLACFFLSSFSSLIKNMYIVVKSFALGGGGGRGEREGGGVLITLPCMYH